MDATGRIQGIVSAADQALAELAKECMALRDYDGATAAIDAARHLSQIVANKAIVPAAINSSSTLPREPVVRPKLTRIKKGEYPKFVRDGDSLIKIGWSKREKAEYEHKSPKHVLKALGQALIQIGANGRRFAMEKVLPLKDSLDSASLPDYQCYLCLAWLRHADLVVQHGRQGYSLHKKLDLLPAIEQAWEKLSLRS